MGMQTIVDDWKANAERHLDRNFHFIHRLKMKSDHAVDRVAHRLHDEAFSIIDCTQCANCCKTISPLFRKSDVRRIAESEEKGISPIIDIHLRCQRQPSHLGHKHVHHRHEQRDSLRRDVHV